MFAIKGVDRRCPWATPHPSGKIGGPSRRGPWERGMGALEYKSFTAYHHVKKIPQPLSMQEILDVISPYLQPSTYFRQMSRVHGIFVCGPLQSFVVNVCTLRNRVPTQRSQPYTRAGVDQLLTRVGTRY